ncbi:MAG: serine/threonine-protein kinase [Planctomycetota bacterium]
MSRHFDPKDRGTPNREGPDRGAPDRDALTPDDPVEELLGECLEHAESDWDTALAAICEANPQHAVALRRRFAALQRIGFAHGEASPAQDLAVARELAASEPEMAAALADAAGIDLTDLPGVPPPADLRLGTRLAGRYHLTARVGAGAMGVVYRARDEDLGRDVAIKLLEAGRFADGKAEARFLQEAELLAQLRHPAIVTLFDRGRSDAGELFLVMELLDGVPMTQALEAAGTAGDRAGIEGLQRALGQPVAERSFVRQVVRWMAELAEGLAAAHRLGILHRDVKPSNVFLCRDGRAVLLDFGIATRGGDLTAAGTVLGTPWYMAPEQAVAGGRLTPALDVYGLTSCLYHLLTGRPPFDGDAMAVLARIAREDPPLLSVQRPDLSRDLHAIVETGMAREPHDRYGSADLLAQDLRAFLEHRPVRARPLSRATRLWRAAKRRPAWLALAAAGVLVLALGSGLAVAHARESAHARRERKAEIEARLPESLAFEGDPEQRLLECVRPEHRAFLAELDELIELDPDDLPPRLWRAALRLDEGQHDAAAGDLAHVAGHSTSAYLRAVADRYQQAARDLRGTKAIDLSNLGVAPTTPAECFVAGFHELRNRHVEGFAKRAEDLLGRASAAYLPARDLHLLAMLARADFEDDVSLFHATIEESLRLEGVYGHPTARTCAVRGAAQARLSLGSAAIASLEQSLALRPDRHGPLQNLAVAYHALGDLDKAEAAVAKAAELRPHFWNTAFLRAQILTDRREFARAAAAAAALPETGGPGAAWKKHYLLGCIAAEELWQVRLADAEDPRVHALAETALRELDLAYEATTSGRARVENRRVFVRAVVAGDDDEACVRLLAELSGRVEDPFILHVLTELLPAGGLSARTVAYLRYYLARLAQHGAPQDPTQKLLVQKALEQVKRSAATPPSHDNAK